MAAAQTDLPPLLDAIFCRLNAIQLFSTNVHVGIFMQNYNDIHEKLKQSIPDLSKTLKRSAAYILDHPGDVATLSMRKVAKKAGVPAPNFDRLAKLLGYGTYSELRKIYQQEVQRDIFQTTIFAQNFFRNRVTSMVMKLFGLILEGQP